MKRIFCTTPRIPAKLLLLSAALFLSACQAVNYGLPGSGSTGTTPTVVSLPVKTGPASGEVLGTGQTRVALLLPMTAPGNGSAIASEYRNAAELAITTRGEHTMELVIKDTGGTAAGAIARTEEAVREGSAIILGPVFSGSVTSAASVARPNNRIMIAFSSDPSAASDGVFLMSFLPNQIVDRTVSYATGIGLTSFSAILPQGAYGALVERQLRATLAAQGGVLNGVSRYEYSNESVVAAVQEILPAIEQSDAIFIPDGGTAPVAIARVMQAEGIKLRDKRLIGTGQWRSSKLASPFLQGAIFADMDQSGFEAFKLQYKEKFQAEPTVNAGLGYDAVGLVADLLATGNPAALSRQGLEKPSGFHGVTGVFRFLKDGETQRGLAVYQVQEGEVTVVDPAPQQFSGFQSAQFYN
ncbi:penicillin-binding protein activator [Hoeflea sp. TYP-13]|uniref:penicillin-binding protein activator n=1 Tax=Hoeflea sp. TYP-13 TaxID=3230023 RepID=UPI0034C661E3